MEENNTQTKTAVLINRKFYSYIEEGVLLGYIQRIEERYTAEYEITQKFEPIYVYRKVKPPVTKEKFYSQAYYAIHPENPFHEVDLDTISEIGNYATSFSTDVETLKKRFLRRSQKLNKQITVASGWLEPNMGYKFVEYSDTSHIMLFPFEDAMLEEAFNCLEEV